MHYHICYIHTVHTYIHSHIHISSYDHLIPLATYHDGHRLSRTQRISPETWISSSSLLRPWGMEPGFPWRRLPQMTSALLMSRTSTECSWTWWTCASTRCGTCQMPLWMWFWPPCQQTYGTLFWQGKIQLWFLVQVSSEFHWVLVLLPTFELSAC